MPSFTAASKLPLSAALQHEEHATWQFLTPWVMAYHCTGCQHTHFLNEFLLPPAMSSISKAAFGFTIAWSSGEDAAGELSGAAVQGTAE